MINAKEFTQRTKSGYLITAILLLSGCTCTVTNTNAKRAIDRDVLKTLNHCKPGINASELLNPVTGAIELTYSDIACLLQKSD